jgi:hypothetical protein
MWMTKKKGKKNIIIMWIVQLTTLKKNCMNWWKKRTNTLFPWSVQKRKRKQKKSLVDYKKEEAWTVHIAISL